MKREKVRKIVRRLLTREYHHLDASAYLEAIIRELEGDPSLKSRYLVKLGRTYRCGISIICLGEIAGRLAEIKNDIARKETFEFLGKFLHKQKIEICPVIDDDIELFHELRELDNRVHAPNLLALAIAIREKAHVFMTFDEDMLESVKLRDKEFKRKYKIKIRKPVKD